MNTIRKGLLGFAALTALSIASVVSAPAAHAWSALAVSDNGSWGFASGFGGMESARRAAVNRCRTMGGSCSASTAESDGWYYSGGVCDGRAYTAASPRGWWRSDQLVRAKAAADGYGSCSIVAQQ